MNKDIIKHILSVLDHSELRSRLNVTDRAIRLARENGYFAASWYRAVKQMCDKAGIDCPLCAFNMRGFKQTQSGIPVQLPGKSSLAHVSG